jgi:ketosteroid isomerase-like protein
MRLPSVPFALALTFLAAARPAAAQRPDLDSLAQQVRESERAFAATMAARDLRAFGTFVSAEALFYGRTVLRGRDAVVAGWTRFFQGTAAPFSWEPATVEVLESGTLALSSGPVRDPAGRPIGTFNSIWRREADGRWRVVFDKGCDVCTCPPAP